ncbi:prepilin peptidase [Pirellulaceae bacterium SH501]
MNDTTAELEGQAGSQDLTADTTTSKLSASINAFAHSNQLEGISGIPAVRRKRRRWLRVNWMLLIPMILWITGWYLYTYPGVAWEESLRRWWDPKPRQLAYSWSSPQRELIRTIQYLATFWFFYLGASIGSFFNVVAGRWPVGKGIVFGGSKCPFCANRLRFIHNTPIIGWLWCKGRCAFCHLPIATRYLWMEVAIGSIFMVLMFRELITGGANLPHWRLESFVGFENTIFSPKWILITAYLQHAVLFASIVMLISSSTGGLRFPWSGWFVFVACVCLPKLIQLQLEFVRWTDGLPIQRSFPIPHISAASTVLAGLIMGGLVGAVTAKLLPSWVEDHARRHWCQASVMLGAVLGWQAVVAITVSAWLLSFLTWIPFRDKSRAISISTLATLLVVGFVHHMFWREIVSMIGL